MKLIDGYYVEGQILLLMEFCDGGSLEGVLESFRGLPASAKPPALPVGSLTCQMLSGVRYMHDQMKQVTSPARPPLPLVDACARCA